MPAYPAMPKDPDPISNFVGILAYNVALLGVVITLLWFVFPHTSVWKLVALVTAVRIIIHGEILPQPPADQ